MSENLPEIYAGPYGAGKTFDLMKACHEAGGVFVTSNVDGAMLMALALGYDFPILPPAKVPLVKKLMPRLFVDNAEEVLEEFLQSSVVAVSINGHYRRTSGAEASEKR